jgi:hypothetical protein
MNIFGEASFKKLHRKTTAPIGISGKPDYFSSPFVPIAFEATPTENDPLL